MNQRYLNEFLGQQQGQEALVFAEPPFISRYTWQSSGTTQLLREGSIDDVVRTSDIAQRISILEEKLERLEKLFTVSIIPINTLNDENWDLEQPLNVAIEQRDEENFVACLYDVDLYGYGETVPDALEDLKYNLINQFEYLLEIEREVELGDLLKRQLEFLRKNLVNINA